jgi:hypothetical protein
MRALSSPTWRHGIGSPLGLGHLAAPPPLLGSGILRSRGRQTGEGVAAEMLEQWRAFLVSEMRGFGSSLDKLYAFDEALADKFASTSCALSFPPSRMAGIA